MRSIKYTTIHPIVILAMEKVHVKCVRYIKDLAVDTVLAVVYKAVLLNTCHIVYFYPSDQKEGGQPFLNP